MKIFTYLLLVVLSSVLSLSQTSAMMKEQAVAAYSLDVQISRILKLIDAQVLPVTPQNEPVIRQVFIRILNKTSVPSGWTVEKAAKLGIGSAELAGIGWMEQTRELWQLVGDEQRRERSPLRIAGKDTKELDEKQLEKRKNLERIIKDEQFWLGKKESTRNIFRFIEEGEALKNIEECLKQNADPNATNIDGKSPLHCAAEKGRADVIELLLARSVTVDVRDKNFQTPLFYAAASSGNAVKLLLQAKADVQGKNHDTTPLHNAASHGCADAAEILLASGAKVNNFNHSGHYPLDYAIANMHIETVRVLLNAGAQFRSIRHILSCGQEIISMLLKSDTCKDVLHMAVNEGHIDAIKLLLAAQAEVNALDEHGNPILHTAIESYRTNEATKVDIVKILIEAGARVDTPNNNGDNPLKTAFLKDLPQVARLLLQAGARLVDPMIIFGYKFDTTRAATIKILAEFGACAGYLHVAVTDMPEIVKILIEAGGDPNERDAKGNTPLHMAVRRFRKSNIIEIVKMLLAAGADSTFVNNKDETPLAVAKQKHPSISAELEELLTDKASKKE